jgi:phage terminase large subunit-like protein
MRKGTQNYIFAYYQQIKDGSVTVGQWVRRIYEYVVTGLQNKDFFFDQKKANHAVNWIEHHCFHTEGEMAPGALTLELWQKAYLSVLFGVVDQNGNRQFREALLVVARKNGKTLFASAVVRYIWCTDGFGTRCYCVAPKLDQAELAYNSIWVMTTLDPEYQEKYAESRVLDSSRRKMNPDDPTMEKHRQTDLFIPGTNSTVKKIAFNAKKSDGFNPSITLCDEIASWQGDAGLKQYEVMKSGMGARKQSILLSISTAGYVNDGIYDELLKRSTRFINGDSKEKRLFPVLYMIDDVDKWNDINELKKANPNLGVSVTVDYLLEEIAIAEGSLSKRNEFLVKYANIKQNSSAAWLESKVIDNSIVSGLTLEDFHGCYCVGGIDLSRTTDLTAACIVIERDGISYVFTKFWMPGERVEEMTQRDGIPYNIYLQKGYLNKSGENFIDYNDCFNWFKELVEKHEILPLKVGYDRYNAQYLTNDMMNYGFHMDSVYQGTNLSPIISECSGLLADGKLKIIENDVMKMHMFDSALKTDSETMRNRLVKVSQNVHIDGMAALLDALTVRQKWYSEIGAQLKNQGR